MHPYASAVLTAPAPAPAPHFDRPASFDAGDHLLLDFILEMYTAGDHRGAYCFAAGLPAELVKALPAPVREELSAAA